jgi:hypothetical protein
VTDQANRRQRFLQESPERRLGAIAANLSRIRSCLASGRDGAAALGMIGESRNFIEWSIPELDTPIQADLQALDSELATWLDRWEATWGNLKNREAAGQAVGTWCDRVLDLTGLQSA